MHLQTEPKVDRQRDADPGPVSPARHPGRSHALAHGEVGPGLHQAEVAGQAQVGDLGPAPGFVAHADVARLLGEDGSAADLQCVARLDDHDARLRAVAVGDRRLSLPDTRADGVGWARPSRSRPPRLPGRCGHLLLSRPARDASPADPAAARRTTVIALNCRTAALRAGRTVPGETCCRSLARAVGGRRQQGVQLARIEHLAFAKAPQRGKRVARPTRRGAKRKLRPQAQLAVIAAMERCTSARFRAGHIGTGEQFDQVTAPALHFPGRSAAWAHRARCPDSSIVRKRGASVRSPCSARASAASAQEGSQRAIVAARPWLAGSRRLAPPHGAARAAASLSLSRTRCGAGSARPADRSRAAACRACSQRDALLRVAQRAHPGCCVEAPAVGQHAHGRRHQAATACSVSSSELRWRVHRRPGCGARQAASTAAAASSG